MTQCCTTRRGVHGWGIGAIAPESALTQYAPDVTSKQHAAMLAWVSASQLLNSSGAPAYIPGSSDCSKAGTTGPSQNVKLAQTSAGLALTGINVAAVAISSVGAAIGTVLAPMTMGISAVIGLFPLLFAHHAAAVAKEQNVLCSAVPAANNYLQIISQAVQSGAATPQQGQAALDSLVSDFRSQVSSIYKKCNAACVMSEGLAAIAASIKSQFQDMITASAAAGAAVASGYSQVVTSSRPGTTAAAAVTPASSYSSFYASGNSAPVVSAPAASSSWLPITLLAVGFFLVRGL